MSDYSAPGLEVEGVPATGDVPTWNVGGFAEWAMGSGSGTISDITTSTLTITDPTGPTTTIDIPTTYAKLASPAFSGSPTAPTKAPLTDNTDLATTAYTDLAVAVETARAEAAESLLAPLASPAFSGSPTAPTQAAGDNSTKLATDAFVTTAIANAIAGNDPAVAVQAATIAAGDTSGFTFAGAGVGATMTGAVNTAVTIDGFTFTAVGQRLLVKNDTQAPSGAHNGIYVLTQLQTALLAPIFTRATDYNTPANINNTGAIPVVSGTVNATTSWIQTAQIVTVDTTPMVFVQFSLAPTTVLLKANNLSDVADAGSSRFNIAVPSLSAAAAVAIANVNIASPGGTFDGYAMQTSDEILLTAQSTPSQNGVWMWNGAASALTRPNEFPHGGLVKRGRICAVINGTVYANTIWLLDGTAAGQTIDTTSLTWVRCTVLFNRYAVLTTTGNTFVVPAGVTKIKVRCRGGGGQGGGAGGATGSTLQAGAGGGGAGEVKDEECTVASGDTLTATIGAGGSAAGGGGTPGNTGASGSSGGTTTLTDTTTSTTLCTAVGGGIGFPSGGNSTTQGIASNYGVGSTTAAAGTVLTPGSGAGTPSRPSGAPFIGNVGGGLGGAATSTLGGGAGPANTTATNATSASQGIGSSGASANSTGQTGTAATTPGCGGGGGGGGAAGTGNGGTGGAGGPGLIEIWW